MRSAIRFFRRDETLGGSPFGYWLYNAFWATVAGLRKIPAILYIAVIIAGVFAAFAFAAPDTSAPKRPKNWMYSPGAIQYYKGIEEALHGTTTTLPVPFKQSHVGSGQPGS